jgi:diketogulonate reductase-like aldo/keto reductase
VKTVSGKDISKIGIGSYGIGGRGHRDMDITEKDEDQKYIDALVYTLNKGANFTEIALGYGQGQSLALFKQALDTSNINRQDIFLTHSIYPRDLPTIEVVNEDIASFYKIMEIEYADSTLITQSLIIKFGEEAVYPLLHKLLEKGNTRYVSLSNASPNWIRKFKNEFGDKFFAHEGHLSYEVRALQDKGVLKACDELSIKNIIWRPLRRNKTLQHNWKLLAELAEKYSKTQSQIVLNWICHLGYAPMVFSTSQAHIDENITCNDFEMSAEDYKLMTDFRPTNYQPPQVDWEGAKIDDDIVVLANNFEEYLL